MPRIKSGLQPKKSAPDSSLRPDIVKHWPITQAKPYLYQWNIIYRNKPYVLFMTSSKPANSNIVSMFEKDVFEDFINLSKYYSIPGKKVPTFLERVYRADYGPLLDSVIETAKNIEAHINLDKITYTNERCEGEYMKAISWKWTPMKDLPMDEYVESIYGPQREEFLMLLDDAVPETREAKKREGAENLLEFAEKLNEEADRLHMEALSEAVEGLQMLAEM